MSQTITVTLTDASGATGTAQVTLSPPVGGGPPDQPPVTGAVPPAQAKAAGFTRLVFEDDFTDPATIATSAAPTVPCKWHWSPSIDYNITRASWQLNSRAMASGAGASPAGGVLTLNSVRASHNNFWGNSTFQTLPRGVSSVPAGVSWRHAYFECYGRLPGVLGSPSGLQADGWPAFWAWGAEGASSYWGSQPGWSSLNANVTEVDFLEDLSGVSNWWPSNSGHHEGNVFYPAGRTNRYNARYSPALSDHNWHKWGCLWTGGSPPRVSFWFDDVQQGGADVSATSIENTTLMMIIGSGIAWPFDLDWVRVWQAPS